eukprot:1179639-Rhodomonas_salina.1
MSQYRTREKGAITPDSGLGVRYVSAAHGIGRRRADRDVAEAAMGLTIPYSAPHVRCAGRVHRRTPRPIR